MSDPNENGPRLTSRPVGAVSEETSLLHAEKYTLPQGNQQGGAAVSDFDKMWAALEAYQPHADAAGHGESWKCMTQERTSEAADSARKAALSTNTHAYAVGAAMEVVKTEWAISRAIEYINKAMQEVQP